MNVHTLSQGELESRSKPEDWVGWIASGAQGLEQVVGCPEDVRTGVIRGGYPEPLKRPTRRRADRWFDSYLHGLTVHDAKNIATNSQYPLHLERFLRLVAAQGHAEFVKAKTARSLGIAESTLNDYAQLASMMYLIAQLPSWGIGFSGRVVRRPKISLADSGFASFLTDATEEKSLLVGGYELFGSLLEGFVVSELRKQATWSHRRFRLFHYRKRTTEIDCVVELADGRVILVEVKGARSITEKAWRHITTVTNRLGSDRVIAGVVLYLADRAYRIQSDSTPILLLPVDSLWKHPDL